MRVAYRIGLAVVMTVVFTAFGMALILVGKEGYVPKALGIAGAIALLPNLLLWRLGFHVPWAMRQLEWVVLVVVQFAYCYALLLLIELLLKKFRRRRQS